MPGNSALNGSGPVVATSFGGNLFVKNCSLDIYNSTITGGAAASGRDLYVIGLGAGQTATAHLYSSILAQADATHNYDVNVTEDLGGDAIVSGANNLARSHNLPRSMVISSDDPLLGPLANNGGPTLTHSLQSASPAVGRGSNPLNLTSDQRSTGFSRNIGGQPDIGAFEIQSPIFQNFSGDYNGDNSVNAGDYVLWRKTLGTPVPQFSAADGNGNSTVDPGDYDVWRGHFGALPAAGNTVDLLLAINAAPETDRGQIISTIDGALLATLAPPTSRDAFSADSSCAAVSCTSRAQSSISLEQRDEALLTITSSPMASKVSRFTATRRVNPEGKDSTQPPRLTAGLTQSLPQILP